MRLKSPLTGNNRLHCNGFITVVCIRALLPNHLCKSGKKQLTSFIGQIIHLHPTPFSLSSLLTASSFMSSFIHGPTLLNLFPGSSFYQQHPCSSSQRVQTIFICFPAWFCSLIRYFCPGSVGKLV